MGRTAAALFTLYRYRLAALRNMLRGLHRESKLKVIVILLVGSFIWWLLYRLGRFSFYWLQSQNPLVAGMVVEFTFNIFFFSLGVMLLVSNVIICYSTLFENDDTVFLYGMPLDKRAVFLAKGLEAVSFSSWAVAFLWLPVLFAYGAKHDTPAWFYPASIAAMFVYIVLIGTMGAILNLLVAVYAPRNRKKILAWAIGLTMAALIGYFCYAAAVSRTGEGPRNQWVLTLPARFEFLASGVLPSHWMTQGFLATASGDARRALIYFGALASTAAFSLGAAYALGILLYERAWDRVRSSSSRQGARSRLFDWLLRLARGRPGWLLLAKDLTLFRRDPAQWMQFAVLLGLILIYILNIRSIGYHAVQMRWKILVATLNLCSIMMVLATLSTRFFFPLISLEGRRFWILGLAPVTRGQILRAKFEFAFTCNGLLALGLVFLSNSMLAMETAFMVSQIAIVFVASAALAALAVGLGAAFPDFNAQSPSRVVSGFGGTLTLVIASSYVIFLTVLQGMTAFRWARTLRRGTDHHTTTFWVCAGLGLLVSAVAVAAPLWWGARHLKRAEL